MSLYLSLFVFFVFVFFSLPVVFEFEFECFTCNTLTYGSLVPLLAITFVFEALSLYYSYSNDARDVPPVIL